MVELFSLLFLATIFLSPLFLVLAVLIIVVNAWLDRPVRRIRRFR